MKKSVEKICGTSLVWLYLILTSLIVLYPLIYVLSAAFSPQQNIASLSIVPFENGITIENFKYLFTNSDFPLWFKNTLIVALATTISTLVVCSLSAYVFSRFTFVFKKSLMMSMLILQIFPSFVGMVAIYVILLRIGGLNTLWGLVLIYLAGNIPYNTWMVKTYLDTIPKSLDEAARIDGASHFYIFRKIIMPVARPIVVLLAMTSFLNPWMDFIYPKLILRSSEVQTIAQGLFGFVTEKKNLFATFSAGALLIAIPFIIFFIVTQKTLITSLSGAAVKE